MNEIVNRRANRNWVCCIIAISLLSLLYVASAFFYSQIFSSFRDLSLKQKKTSGFRTLGLYFLAHVAICELPAAFRRFGFEFPSSCQPIIYALMFDVPSA